MSSSVSTYYSQGGKWCSLFNEGMENTGRLMKVIESFGRIACYFKSDHGFSKTVKIFDSAGAAVSAMRLLNSLHKFLSGQAFWTQNADGTFKKTEYGDKVVRSWSDIVFDIVLAVGRFFGTVLYFSKLKLYELGKHARWMGAVVITAYTAVVSLQLIKGIQDALEEIDIKKVRMRIADVASALLDFVAFPWDAGLGFNNHPILALVGAILSALSALVYLIKEWVYFNAFPANA